MDLVEEAICKVAPNLEGSPTSAAATTTSSATPQALARARLREITFHQLRHTFGTHLAAAGTPLRAIQEWMGHADAKTTEVYRHYEPDPTGGAAMVERAFATGPNLGPKLSEPVLTQQDQKPLSQAESDPS